MARRRHDLFSGLKRGKGRRDRPSPTQKSIGGEGAWPATKRGRPGGVERIFAGYSRRGSNPLDFFPLRGAKAFRWNFFAARGRSPRPRLDHTVRQKRVVVLHL